LATDFAMIPDMVEQNIMKLL